MKYLSIAALGLIGVFLRYFVDSLFERLVLPGFPYSTFVINIVGAFLIGTVYTLGVENSIISTNLRIGLMVGLLGGFTTFSSYCLQTVRLLEEQRYWVAVGYLFMSPILGFVAAFGGIMSTRFLLRVEI